MDNTQRWQEIVVEFTDGPRAWLAARAKQYGLTFLLAHVETGVIWGKYDGTTLALSSDQGVFQRDGLELDAQILHDARLFGLAGELFVWQVAPDKFAARLIADGAVKQPDDIEEVQWLWGAGAETRGDFTQMQEGQQGLRHAPPMGADAKTRLGLRVRHYVEYDSAGRARIALSRLVNLEIAERGKA